MSDAPRPRPRAFRLDEAARHRIDVQDLPDVFALPLPEKNEEAAVETAQKRGLLARAFLSWGGLFWSAAGTLALMAAGLWFDRLIVDLFARAPALGWMGIMLIALLVLSLGVLAGREMAAIMQQKHIARMHLAFAQAREADDRNEARRLVKALSDLYAMRPDTARARADMSHLSGEIVDGRDLIDIAETRLMSPLDEEIQREIATAAKRVSIVTAVSPRAAIDLIFVGAQAFRLVRRIAEIYGGRPGALGFFRLMKSVGAHLAITGGMAAGDSLVQQFLGHGLASRLSARLGEGVLNGLLTARVGLSAMAVCRPLPFAAKPAPGLKDVAPFLFGDKKDED